VRTEHMGWPTRSRRRRLGIIAGAAVPVLALTAAGQAQAAQHGGTARTARAAVAGGISTVVGGAGGPGTATKIPLNHISNVGIDTPVGPCGVTFSRSLYIAQGYAVRKVNPATDTLTTPAGTFESGPAGDGGPATAASLDACSVAMDQHGNLIVADQVNGLRVVAAKTGMFYGQAMTKGDIYTVNGWAYMGAITVDGNGNIVGAQQFEAAPDHGAVLNVLAAKTGYFYDTHMTAGDVYKISGSWAQSGTVYSGNGGPVRQATLGTYLGDIRTDAAGNIVMAAATANRVLVIANRTGTYYGQAMTKGHIYSVVGTGTAGFAGDGGPAISAEFSSPEGLAVDGSGNLVIGDTSNERVRVVAAQTGTFYGQAMTAGDVYTVAGGSYGFAGDGGPATAAAFRGPSSVTVDGSGNLVINDLDNYRVRVVAAQTGTFYGQAMTAGDIYTVAGNATAPKAPCCSGAKATSALLVDPGTVASDPAGNTLVADGNEVQAVAASSGTFYGKAMKAGDIYTLVTSKMDGDESPTAIAVDPGGNLVLADAKGNKILVYAASTGTFYGQAMTAGNVYTVAGTGTAGRSGTGGVATAVDLNDPTGVTVDSAGNLVISDGNNQVIQVVATTTGTFYGQAMTAGHLYRVAGDSTFGFSGDGGPATKAQLGSPGSVQVDGSGNLVIADFGNSRIRVVAESTGTFYGQAMTAGDIYTVAGGGSGFTLGDPATSVALPEPDGMAIDSAGNLAFLNTDSDAVWVVAESNGTFYGQAMTAGDIYQVAGTGTYGFSGDGGPAVTAELAWPADVAATAAGNLLIADSLNDRVRQVEG